MEPAARSREDVRQPHLQYRSKPRELARRPILKPDPIDYTRSFTPKKDMVHQMTRIDQELWDKMKALTVESLTPALQKWIGNREIRAIIERRDRMQTVIEKLIATNTEAAVFVR